MKYIAVAQINEAGVLMVLWLIRQINGIEIINILRLFIIWPSIMKRKLKYKACV